MSVFGSYAKYYDSLYNDKDYVREVEYIHLLIQKYAPGAMNIVEFGCGTGAHAILLARREYRVVGIDFSDQMLSVAARRVAGLEKDLAGRISFVRADIREGGIFSSADVALSLFHVMSYQTSNSDLASAFSTVSANLRSGGVFIFDCWYGPAVLNILPSNRVKRIDDGEYYVVRLAEPVLHVNDNRVDVNYEVYIHDKASGCTEILKETHWMRYLFKPEIASFLEKAGMELIHCEEWVTGTELSQNTWGGCFVCRKL